MVSCKGSADTAVTRHSLDEPSTRTIPTSQGCRSMHQEGSKSLCRCESSKVIVSKTARALDMSRFNLKSELLVKLQTSGGIHRADAKVSVSVC